MDGVISVRGGEYVDTNHRSDEQHTYRSHHKVEMNQMFGRSSFYDIISFHISHSQECEEQDSKEDKLNSQISILKSYSVFSTQSDTSFCCTSTNPPRISSCCPSYSTTPFWSVEIMGA